MEKHDYIANKCIYPNQASIRLMIPQNDSLLHMYKGTFSRLAPEHKYGIKGLCGRRVRHALAVGDAGQTAGMWLDIQIYRPIRRLPGQ